MTYLMQHESLTTLLLVSFIALILLLLFIFSVCQVIKLAESPLTLNVIGKRWRTRKNNKKWKGYAKTLDHTNGWGARDPVVKEKDIARTPMRWRDLDYGARDPVIEEEKKDG